MLLFVNLAAASALAGGFGQFAFGHTHTLPAFEVSPEYFQARATGGVRFLLGSERTGFLITNASRYGKVLTMRPKSGAPLRIFFEPLSAGFSLEYKDGFTIAAESVETPYITWSEGSVGMGVPSAPSKWLLLSWPKKRPPILLVFDKPAAAIVRATAEGFSLQSDYSGIVFVRAPFGQEAIATSNAADLGALAARLISVLPKVSTASPKLIGTSVSTDTNGLTAEWQFDRAGAVLPAPLLQGVAAGSAKILSRYETLSGRESGLWISSDATMRVRFLTRKLGYGAAAVLGKPFASAATISHIDTEGICQAALDYLCGNTDAVSARAIADAASLFEDELKLAKDPITLSPLAFEKNGAGSALGAAHTFAGMAMNGESRWLEGFAGSVDWVDWLPAGGDLQERRAAAAILSLAGALSDDDEVRVLAAMCNCAADGTELSSVREWIYPNAAKINAEHPAWYDAMFSPIRILSTGFDFAMEPKGFVVLGEAASTKGFRIELAADAPLSVFSKLGLENVNVLNLEGQAVIGATPSAPGEWKLTLVRQTPGRPLPAAAPSPRYSAGQR